MGFCHSTTRKNTQMQTIWDSHLAFHHPKKIFCLAVVDWGNHDFSLKGLVTQIPGGFQLSDDEFKDFFQFIPLCAHPEEGDTLPQQRCFLWVGCEKPPFA